MKARKLDTSGKLEPPADKASLGREKKKEFNSLYPLNPGRGFIETRKSKETI
jgi:hypothetical protein